MKTKARAFVLAAILLTALLVPGSIARGQRTTPSPPPSQVEPAAKPAAEPDFWHQDELTGDWGGRRSRWEEKGVEMEFELTQFYQGVASGGLREGSEYNGKFGTGFKFDFGKLWGWKFWSAEVKTETRFGGPSVGGTGALNPVNTAVTTPGADGGVFSVVTATVTKIFPRDLKKGELFVLSVGRFNTLDLLAEDFFAGAGTKRFFNVAQNGALAGLREVPLITNGAAFAYLKGGEPFISFAVLDPNDHSRDAGLDDLFADGVTFGPGVNFPTHYGGKTGAHSVNFFVTTKKFSPFDSIRQIVIPGPPRNPVEPKRGSWSLNYTFRQYLVERARKDGWGFFGQVQVANKDTSPVTSFATLGLGGNGLFKGRPRDEFGVAYSYTGLSSVLKDNLGIVGLGGRLRGEHQFETFYNLHVTPWLRLTGDLQVVRPTQRIADTAIIPGARLEVIF